MECFHYSSIPYIEPPIPPANHGQRSLPGKHPEALEQHVIQSVPGSGIVASPSDAVEQPFAMAVAG
jgi:hypothetical protein